MLIGQAGATKTLRMGKGGFHRKSRAPPLAGTCLLVGRQVLHMGASDSASVLTEADEMALQATVLYGPPNGSLRYA